MHPAAPPPDPGATGAAGRLAASWVYGGAMAGVLLLLLAPVLTAGWPAPARLAYLALPAYMLHQWEEHDADRFRRFVNATLGGGREVLTVREVFWINILGVWGLLGLTLWLVRDAGSGWGVMAGWLLLVNGALHGGQALAMRRSNPGLWSGLAVLLPLGAAILWATWGEASVAQQALSLLAVVLIHAAIVLRVRAAIAARPIPA